MGRVGSITTLNISKYIFNMKILVTGGAGFIGTNLIKRLLDQNNTVFSLDNYSTGLRENEIEGCVYIRNSINNISAYDRNAFLKDIDVVYHLAAIARIQPSFERPGDYIDTNFNGTFEIVKYCVEHGIPLVYAGSSSKHNGRFKNPYTFSKDLGEDIVKLYQEHFNLKASIARFYNVYGPYQLKEGSYTTVIGKWLDNVEKGLPCEIYGDGEQRRDFTHVDDIVEALCTIAVRKAYGYEFELGRGENYSLNELRDVIGSNKFRYVEAKVGEARETLNTDKTAQNILGWNPNINVLDYIKKTFK